MPSRYVEIDSRSFKTKDDSWALSKVLTTDEFGNVIERDPTYFERGLYKRNFSSSTVISADIAREIAINPGFELSLSSSKLK